MSINELASLLQGSLTVSTPAVKAWQVGQVLNALVVGAQADGKIALRVQGEVVLARPDQALNLRAGDTVALKVIRNGELTVLQPQSEGPAPKPAPGTPPPAPAPTPAAETQAWRQNLPLQQPLGPALNRLTQLITELVQTAARPATARPDTVAAQAQQLLRDLPDQKAVATPDGLKNALLRSGLFLENHLARTQTALLGGDLKANLLRLAAAIETAAPAAGRTPTDGRERAAVAPDTQARDVTNPRTPGADRAPTTAERGAGAAESPAVIRREVANPAQGAADRSPRAADAAGRTTVDGGILTTAASDLARGVQGMTARVQVNQLGSLAPGAQGAAPTPPALTLELPVRTATGIDVWRFEIDTPPERDQPVAAEETRPYSVRVRFDLEALGPVEARIQLVGQSVSVTFVAERGATAQRIEQHLVELEHGLHRDGLRVASLLARSGDASTPGQRPQGPLLSLKA